MASKKKIAKRKISVRRYLENNPGMTQEKLARVFKVSQPTISRLLKKE